MTRMPPRALSADTDAVDPDAREQVLVLVGWGLRALVHQLGACAAIRSHHGSAEITALVSDDVAGFVATSPYVDRVWLDPDLSFWQIKRRERFRRALADGRFSRVYDLRGSRASATLRRLLPRDGYWQWIGRDVISGSVARRETWDHQHVGDRLAGLLAGAGIAFTPPPDLSWVARGLTPPEVPFRLTDPYVLLLPDGPEGGLPGAGDVGCFVALAEHILRRRMVPVLVSRPGGSADVAEAAARCPEAVALTDTSLPDLVTLGWSARHVIGNDNALTHLCAAAGCDTVALMGSAFDPVTEGPRGPSLTLIRLADGAPDAADEVLSLLADLP